VKVVEPTDGKNKVKRVLLFFYQAALRKGESKLDKEPLSS
jgi:hypothetical protein